MANLQVVRCSTEDRGRSGAQQEEDRAPEARAAAQEARLWHELVEGAARLQDMASMASKGEGEGEIEKEDSTWITFETAPISARTHDSSSSRPPSSQPTGAARVGADGLGQTELIMPEMVVPCVDGNLNENENENDNDIGEVGAIEVIEEVIEEVRRQTRSVLHRLQLALVSTHRCAKGLGDCVFVHLYVKNIQHFSVINEEYVRAFSGGFGGGLCPPSRCCVAVPLPNLEQTGISGSGSGSRSRSSLPVYVAIDALFYADSYAHMLSRAGLNMSGSSARPGTYNTDNTDNVCTADRRVLHVRSVSEWAPLCVGPYSQGNLLGGSAGTGGAGLLALPAGQIPLCPGTMGLHTPPLSLTQNEDGKGQGQGRLLESLLPQLLLSLRHASRVVRALAHPTGGVHGSKDKDLTDIRHATQVTVYLDIAHYKRLTERTERETETELSKTAQDNHFHAIRGFVQMCVRKNCQWAGPDAGAAGSDGSDGGYDSQEIDEDDEEEEVNIRPCPVLIMCVSGIPKGALVEVEVQSVTNEMPLESLRGGLLQSQRTQTQTQTNNFQVTLIKDVREPVLPLFDWPIWRPPVRHYVPDTDTSPVNAVNALCEEGDGGLEMDSGAANVSAPLNLLPNPPLTFPEDVRLLLGGFYSRCAFTHSGRGLCSGQVITHRHKHTVGDIDIDIDTDWTYKTLYAAFLQMLNGVRAALATADARCGALRTVRTYYDASAVSLAVGGLRDKECAYTYTRVKDAYKKALNDAMPVDSCPVVLLPVEKVEGGAVFCCSFLAADFIQLGTEQWVSKASNFHDSSGR